MQRPLQTMVIGGSGYTGLELVRLLEKHPLIELIAVTSSRYAGQNLSDHGLFFDPDSKYSNLHFISHQEAEKFFDKVEIVFLATPAEESLRLAPEFLSRKVRVIDLSGAFRIKDQNVFETVYKLTAPDKQLQASAHYGLVDLFDTPKETSFISNPGCYATAAALSIAPFAELLDFSHPIIIHGQSGTTGAGRKAEETLLFSEASENIRAYRIGNHQHTPEIIQALTQFCGRDLRIIFTPHLIPMRRGILISTVLRVHKSVNSTQVQNALQRFSKRSPMLRVVTRSPETKYVQNTNITELYAFLDSKNESILSFAAIDNLQKGAAGQAIENLNRLLGLPQETALR